MFDPIKIAVVLAVSSFVGCSSQGGPIPALDTASSAGAHRTGATANWPQQGVNAAHTGYNTLEKTLGVGNVGSLTQLWSFPTGAQLTAPILVQNGIAYINSADGYLYAVNAATGAQVWKFQTFTGGGSQDNPAFADGRVFVGCLVGGNSQQNGLCALHAANGTLDWSYYEDCNCLPAEGLSAAPVVSGKTVLIPYFATYNFGSSRLIAVDAVSGKVLWQYGYPGGNSGGPSAAAPAVANGSVYVGQGYSNSVCSLQLSSGVPNWCSSTNDSGNSVAAAKGVVYVNTSNHGVYAFKASSGAQIWQFTPAAGNYSGHDDPPAVAKGTVYVAGVGFSGNLYALKASSGSLIYHTTSGSGGAENTTSSPSIANAVAYVECQSGLCAFNASTGALLFTPNSSGSSQSSPAIVNGTVYETCGPNTACAYALPSTRKK